MSELSKMNMLELLDIIRDSFKLAKTLADENDALRARVAELEKRIEPYVTMMDYDDIVWFTERLRNA